MMTDQEIFQTLLKMAYAFGCDIITADREDFPKSIGEARGFFNVKSVGLIMKQEEAEIWLWSGLSLEEKIGTMCHEIAHLAFYLFGIPYQELHEVVATLFGKCLLAALREDWANPLFEIGPIVQLEKRFLKLLREKQDRTQEGIFEIDQAYFKWKKGQEEKEG